MPKIIPFKFLEFFDNKQEFELFKQKDTVHDFAIDRAKYTQFCMVCKQKLMYKL